MPAIDTMQNAMFYASSSVAGTFGSAVSIIVAAAIFRLQRIDQNCSTISEKLNEFEEDKDSRRDLNRIAMSQDWEKYQKHWRDLHPDDSGKQTPQEKLWWLIVKFHRKSARIRNETTYLVLYTLGLIAGCFILIGFNHLISLGGPALCGFFVLCVVVPACACLNLYGCLAKELIDKPVDYDEQPKP